MVDRIIRIRIDASDANRGIRQIEGNMQGLATTVSRVAAGVAAAIAGGALAKFLNDSAQAARKFEASISNLSAITGAVGQDLEFLRQAALEFGATTTLSASEAAEALKLVASAKPDLLESGEALKEVTRQAILLAEASGSTLADAARTVGNALNQFGEDADQAARFVNVLAAGAKFGSSEIEQTAVALKDAGVAASTAGISFEQTNAAIQVLAATGLSGAQSGTALRNIFLKLDNDVDRNLRPSVVGLEQALINLNQQNLSGAELVKRFGLENIVAGQTLLNNTDKLAELTQKLTGTSTAIEQADKNTDNWNGDLKELGSAFEALQIQVGSKFLGTLRELTQETTELISAIAGNEEALAKWGGTFEVVYNAALLTTAIVGARLTAALVLSMKQLYLNAAAALAAKTTYDAFGLAVTRTTVAANVGAVAMRGLGGALALVGGPLGAAILAAGGLAFFVTQAVISQREAERLARQASGLNKELLETNRIYELYAEKQSEVAASSLSGLGQEELQAQFDKSSRLIEIYTRRLDQLKESGASLARTSELEERIAQQRRLLEEIQKAVPGVKQSASADEEAAKRSAALAENLGDLAARVSLASTEYSVFSERQKLIKEGFSTAEIEDYLQSFRKLLELQEQQKAASQDEQTAARINSRIEGLRLETQTISSEYALQAAIRQQVFTQEEADLANQTANRILSAVAEREILLAEDAITKEQQLEVETAFQEQLSAINQLYGEQRLELQRQVNLEKQAIEQQTQQTYLDTASTALGALAGLVGGSTKAAKALKLVQAGVNAFQVFAASQAAAALVLATPPGPVLNPALGPLAASIIAKGKVSAAAILAGGAASAFSGGGGSSGLGSLSTGGSASGGIPTTPQGAQQVQTVEFVGFNEIIDELRNQDGMVSTRFVASILDKVQDANRLRGEG